MKFNTFVSFTVACSVTVHQSQVNAVSLEMLDKPSDGAKNVAMT